MEELERKAKLATILGTLQATLTDFRYLRKIWKNNTEEEALLGVSMTGILDHCVLGASHFIDEDNYEELDKETMVVMAGEEEYNLKDVLWHLKQACIDTNKEWAKKLGINRSAAITCVKPSGTVSQLVDSASGIHGRFSPYYIRRVRADKKDPLCRVLEDAGVPCETDINNPSTNVFSFYKKAPSGSVFSSEQTAMEQLRLWETYQEYWCEHKPSITVYYRDNEFLEVGQWLYNNFDEVSGVSFLPYSEHTYQQAPYETISKEEYKEAMKTFPKEFNWDIEEETDVTEGVQELACVGGACEL